MQTSTHGIVCEAVELPSSKKSMDTYNNKTCLDPFPLYVFVSLLCIIGASLSEPHTTELNSGFFLFYICHTSFCTCMLILF